MLGLEPTINQVIDSLYGKLKRKDETIQLLEPSFVSDVNEGGVKYHLEGMVYSSPVNRSNIDMADYYSTIVVLTDITIAGSICTGLIEHPYFMNNTNGKIEIGLFQHINNMHVLVKIKFLDDEIISRGYIRKTSINNIARESIHNSLVNSDECDKFISHMVWYSIKGLIEYCQKD